MLPFYKNLAKKQPKDIALQTAQIQYLNTEHPELTTPSFWGHLALIGDIKPVGIAKNKHYWWYGILLILSILLGYKVLRQKVSDTLV